MRNRIAAVGKNGEDGWHALAVLVGDNRLVGDLYTPSGDLAKSFEVRRRPDRSFTVNHGPQGNTMGFRFRVEVRDGQD